MNEIYIRDNYFILAIPIQKSGDESKIRYFDLMVKVLVGGDCYHTILTSNRQFNLTSLIGTMAIAPYGVSVC